MIKKILTKPKKVRRQLFSPSKQAISMHQRTISCSKRNCCGLNKVNQPIVKTIPSNKKGFSQFINKMEVEFNSSLKKSKSTKRIRSAKKVKVNLYKSFMGKYADIQ